ncbi:MAG: haloacid dehalogenase [Gemmatimonadales bacterium]|nr:haloacid dehalogenase [Gemmatimonadales bacterium]MYG48771.1 haloacid dehalogenase [Gemmatimonadales bacterium]MYK03323.1 haloacid dehalogenase [Candidatus Palauibacter ramosifaciens]
MHSFEGTAGRGTLLTFDCYGTLIDWEGGILAALRAAYPEAAAVDDERLLGEFHAAQNRLKTSEYRPYRRLLTETSVEVARANGWDTSDESAAGVPASIPSWRPFPDTNPALSRLATAGVTLGILSNIDDDLLAGTLKHFKVDFDLLGTAQRLRSYKPAAPHFERGREWAAGFDRWLHVAQSLFHDVVPATSLRIPVLWVNRKGESRPDDADPVHVAANLARAAEWLLPRA